MADENQENTDGNSLDTVKKSKDLAWKVTDLKYLIKKWNRHKSLWYKWDFSHENLTKRE